MITQWEWIEDDPESDAEIRHRATHAPFVVVHDLECKKGTKKRWWSVMVDGLYVAEFITDPRITKQDKATAASLCILKYGGTYDDY